MPGAIVLERRAAEELALAAVVGATPSPWLAVHTQLSKTVMAFKVRLQPGECLLQVGDRYLAGNSGVCRA